MKLLLRIWSPVRFFIRRQLKPTQLVVLSFAFVVLLGSLLLSLPQAVRSGQQISFTDALFTATSATCVTGLIVLDTPTVFSTFGQLVILACIQVGGLGLMTFTTIFIVAFNRRLAIADRIAIQESFYHKATGKIGTLIKYIVVATFIIEAAGATVLTVYWTAAGRFATFGETIYMAVFHSISAFCNAGFALFSDSLIGFQSDGVVQFAITSLVIIGGLGFLVGLDIKEYIQHVFFRRFWSGGVRERVDSIRPRPRLSVHTKLVLITTLALLAVGTISYYLLERRGLFQTMTGGEAWVNAYFCAVTSRTAGFNTVDYGQMSGGALLCTMVLMFIGASPGSTGGGIKTSTFGLMVAYAVSSWRGHKRLHAFNRTVPNESIDRATAVIIAALALIILASSALMVTETRGAPPVKSQDRMLGLLFETISAFATVGLSLNQTPLLTTAGKLIVSLVMFMGRIGPLTLVLAISLKQRRAQYRYAEENVMVG